MKYIITLSLILMIAGIMACDKMDDNYREYEELNRIYSPKISNLSAIVGLRTATLEWDNPQGDLAKKIMLDVQGDSIVYETMVDSVTLNDLEIKGYDISVYTIDGFGNYSIPVSIQIFPNGENQ